VGHHPNLTPRVTIRLNPVNLKKKAKARRKRTTHLILLKPLPRARKR
jgi:hypothetical protein